MNTKRLRYYEIKCQQSIIWFKKNPKFDPTEIFASAVFRDC